MLEEILKAIPIYLLSMLKVVFGPTFSYASGLHYSTSFAVTFGGMMTSVLIITFFWKPIEEWQTERLVRKT